MKTTETLNQSDKGKNLPLLPTNALLLQPRRESQSPATPTTSNNLAQNGISTFGFPLSPAQQMSFRGENLSP